MANYKNNLDGMSRYEALLVFNKLVLNSELSTLLREKEYSYVEPRIEDNAEGSPEFFLVFKKEDGENTCQVTFKETVIVGSVNDNRIVSSLKDFFHLKEGVQYHVHVTRNLSKNDSMFSIRVVNCLTHEEYVKTPIAQKKEKELEGIEAGRSITDRGWTHFCVICDKELVDKVKGLAKLENFTIREVVEKFLSDGISKYERQYAPIQIERTYRKKRNINDVL